MAIGSIRNKVGINNNNEQISITEKLQNSAIGTTQKSLGLLTSNDMPLQNQRLFNENKIFIQKENPIYNSFKESDGGNLAGSEEISLHIYNYINKFKVCEIAAASLANLEGLNADDPRFGKWRIPTSAEGEGGQNYSSIRVHSNVLLYPAEKNFAFSFSNEYGSAWEKLTSGGLLSKIQSAAEGLRNIAAMTGAEGIKTGGKKLPKYINAPMWTKTSPIQFGTGLKFEFKFGQAGLFSGEHEIVRPILALASMFSPTMDGNYFTGPVPTGPAYLQGLFTALKGKVNDGLSNMRSAGKVESDEEGNVKGGDEAGGFAGIVDKLSKFEDELITIQNNAIEATLSGPPNGEKGSRGIFIRFGRMSFGPFLVKEVSWNFNFEQTDEFGFPYAGDISFSGLEAVAVPSPYQFARIFDNVTIRNKPPDLID